jgi:excisionase family DNA binding protein
VDANRENPGRGLTPNELAAILRVSPDKVRAWIKSGELGAIDVAASRCGKPRWVILPHHLAEFENRRQAVSPPKPKPRKRGKTWEHFFPETKAAGR